VETFDLWRPQVENLTIQRPKNDKSKNPGGKQTNPKGSCRLIYKNSNTNLYSDADLKISRSNDKQTGYAFLLEKNRIPERVEQSKYHDPMTNKLDLPHAL